MDQADAAAAAVPPQGNEPVDGVAEMLRRAVIADDGAEAQAEANTKAVPSVIYPSATVSGAAAAAAPPPAFLPQRSVVLLLVDQCREVVAASAAARAAAVARKRKTNTKTTSK